MFFDTEVPPWPPAPPPPSLARLMGRLVVDAIGFITISGVLTVLLAALAAGGDFLWRGATQFSTDIETLEKIAGGDASALDLSRDGMLTLAFAGGALSYGVVALAITVVAVARRGWKWRDYIAWGGFAFDRVYLALAVVGIAWGVGFGSVIEHLHPEARNWVILPKGPAGVAVSLLLVVVIGPLCEEIIFRGWLYTALRPKFGLVATLLLTAALFAAAHWESTHLYALAVFPMGLLLGYARERSGGIQVTFAFHGIYNFAGWILASVGSK